MTLDDIEGLIDSVPWDGRDPALIAPSTTILDAAEYVLAEWWTWTLDGAGDPPPSIRNARPERVYEFVVDVLDVADAMGYADRIVTLEEHAGWLAALTPALGPDVAAGHFEAAIDVLQESLDPFDPGDLDDVEAADARQRLAVRLSELRAVRSRLEGGASEATTTIVRVNVPTPRGRIRLAEADADAAQGPLPDAPGVLARAVLEADFTRALTDCHRGSGPDLGSVDLDDRSYVQWALTSTGVQVEIRAPRLMDAAGRPADAFIARRLERDGWLPPDHETYVNVWMPVWEEHDCGRAASALTALVVDVLGFDAAAVARDLAGRR